MARPLDKVADMKRPFLSFVLAALSALPSFVQATPLIKDGDRIVFLGDSITEQRLYTRCVMDYLTLRYPELRLTYRNAGWVSDTAPGGLKRLQRDVLDLHPSVVTICYGMNDGGVGAFNLATYQRFINGMEELGRRIRSAGARVALLTPGVVDPDRKNWNSPERMRAYNPTLAQFARGETLMAQRMGVRVYNIHTLMLETQTKAKAASPGFTMIPDGVHPDAAGHALMALGLIRALGCERPVSSLEILNRRIKAERCAVKILKRSLDTLIFSRRDDALPMVFDPGVATLFLYVPELLVMNRYMLRVDGLAAGRWRLIVNGKEVADVDAAELAAGIDLAPLPGPWRELAERVDKLNKEQETAYFTRWRKVQLAEENAEGAAERTAQLRRLDKEIAEKEHARRTLMASRDWQWELNRLP